MKRRNTVFTSLEAEQYKEKRRNTILPHDQSRLLAWWHISQRQATFFNTPKHSCEEREILLTDRFDTVTQRVTLSQLKPTLFNFWNISVKKSHPSPWSIMFFILVSSTPFTEQNTFLKHSCTIWLRLVSAATPDNKWPLLLRERSGKRSPHNRVTTEMVGGERKNEENRRPHRGE